MISNKVPVMLAEKLDYKRMYLWIEKRDTGYGNGFDGCPTGYLLDLVDVHWSRSRQNSYPARTHLTRPMYIKQTVDALL